MPEHASGLAPLILVIEDEPPMQHFLRTALESHDYRHVGAASAREGLTLATGHAPEAILLDLGLPDLDGIELTRRIREWSTTPIIVISARGREQDKVAALDAGADDYLTKPFSLAELLARLRVALRHAARAAGAPEEPVFELGELTVDLSLRQVFVGAKEVHLTPTEYKLLSVLVRHAGKVLTHRQLLNEVWGAHTVEQTPNLRVYMTQLRHKLERLPAQPRYLTTEPGVGYRLRTD
jgi:two-component system KDP operon response regulator KdpE